MAKLPDFSEMSKKLEGIIDSVKSIISPDTSIPKNLTGDPIAEKLELIRTAAATLTNLSGEQQKELAKINALIASLYKDLEAQKTANSGKTAASTTSTNTNPKDTDTKE